jgi:hypothetical protein
MAIGVNSSDKQVLGGSFTGLTNVKVIAINPTKEEMIAMGINAQQEPKYLSQNEKGEAKMRVDFYLASPTPTINFSKSLKVSFWLEDSPRTNKEGTKSQWINKFGMTAWGKTLESMPEENWYSTEGCRKALIGEEDLTSFIKAWANVDPKDQAALDDTSKIAKGDITEIVNLHKAIPNNQVKVLLGVKDGKYQDVYSKCFDRAYRTNFTTWKKALEGQYSEFKSDYQNDLNFKPYTGTSDAPGDSPTDMTTPATANAGAPVYNF